MRRSRFTEAQIIGMIKEQETGIPTADVCRKHGLSQGTFCNFKSKYGSMEVSDAARLKASKMRMPSSSGFLQTRCWTTWFLETCWERTD